MDKNLNKDDLIEYSEKYNIDYKPILNAMESYQKILDNEDNKMDEDLKNQLIKIYTDIKEDVRQLRSEFKEMKRDFRILKADVNATKWILGMLITLFGLFISIQTSALNTRFDSINTKFDSMDAKFDAKYETLIQEIRHNRKMDELQIERDVIKEVSKYNKH